MPNTKKYLEEDFDLYKEGKITFKELKAKYNVSDKTLFQALNRRQIFAKKTRIKLTSPFMKEPKICESITECAEELHLSLPTIYRAIRGDKVATLDKLRVKLEVIK